MSVCVYGGAGGEAERQGRKVKSVCACMEEQEEKQRQEGRRGECVRVWRGRKKGREKRGR